jgi:hypothetical protein
MTLQELQDKYRGQVPVPIVAVATDLGIEVYETDQFDDSISGSLLKKDGKYSIFVNGGHILLRGSGLPSRTRLDTF